MSVNINAETEIQTLLSDLWKRHLPSVCERLDLLEHVAQLSASGEMHEPQREDGESIAHKLAGNLGMFGYKDAGATASEIEQILKMPSPERLVQLTELTHRLREQLAPYLT